MKVSWLESFSALCVCVFSEVTLHCYQNAYWIRSGLIKPK